MFNGDTVLSWRPQNIGTIWLMIIGLSLTVVIARQLVKRFGGGNGQGT